MCVPPGGIKGIIIQFTQKVNGDNIGVMKKKKGVRS